MSQKTAAQPGEQAARGLWRRAVRAVSCCATACMLLALARAASASPGLTLETGSPDALCPALPAARQAVERRLGTLVGAGGAGWLARYTIAHAPAGPQMDFVRLELFAPDGALQLSRDLPLEAGACSTVAEAIALVLDRYFRKLPLDESAAAGGAPAAALAAGAPEAAAPPVLPVAVEPVAAPAAAPARDEPPAAPEAHGKGQPPRFWRIGAIAATGTGTGPALGLQALSESWSHVYTGAELTVDWNAGAQRWADGAEVNARSLGGALTVGWGTRWRALRGHLGPAVRLSWERATARGMAESQERDRARAAAGALLGLVAGLGSHWSLSVSTSLEAHLGAGEFRIDGQEVLRPAPLEGRLALGLGYASSL